MANPCRLPNDCHIRPVRVAFTPLHPARSSVLPRRRHRGCGHGSLWRSSLGRLSAEAVARAVDCGSESFAPVDRGSRRRCCRSAADFPGGRLLPGSCIDIVGHCRQCRTAHGNPARRMSAHRSGPRRMRRRCFRVCGRRRPPQRRFPLPRPRVISALLRSHTRWAHRVTTTGGPHVISDVVPPVRVPGRIVSGQAPARSARRPRIRELRRPSENACGAVHAFLWRW